MNTKSSWLRIGQMFAGGAASLAMALTLQAQVQTETKTTAGQPTHSVTVERGEVVTVNGNELIVKTEDGQMLDFQNVPDSVRISVGGQQLGIHDLKPGMKLERTITTTTTPKTITTTQSVTGTVVRATPPRSVILRLDDNSVERFTIPSGQRFNIGGRDTDAWGLRAGMRITATRVVEEPITVMSSHRQVTGTMPDPPPANVPILIAVVVPPGQAPAEEAPAKLPKTASLVPLVGLLGLLFSVSSIGLTMLRRSRLSW
jgi:hypothetical protein